MLKNRFLIHNRISPKNMFRHISTFLFNRIFLLNKKAAASALSQPLFVVYVHLPQSVLFSVHEPYFPAYIAVNA